MLRLTLRRAARLATAIAVSLFISLLTVTSPALADKAKGMTALRSRSSRLTSYERDLLILLFAMLD